MARSSLTQVIGVCIFIVAISWIVFGPTVHYEFVNFDDDAYVYENGVVRNGLTAEGVGRAFTRPQASNWHPITTISHMADCQFFGLDAGKHHLVNVILHCATAVLLFLVLWQMTGAIWPGAFVAAVFAIHPLRAESVAWVSERKDVLSGLFFMLTLGAYAAYVQSLKFKVPSRRSKVYYALTLMFFALGLMSKPMLVTVPLVLLLLDYWPLKRLGTLELKGKGDTRSKKGRGSPPHPALSPGGGEGVTTPAIVSKDRFRRLIIEKIPMFAMSLAVCVAVYLVQEKARQAAENISFSMRIGNALVSYVAYIGQLFYPANLAAFYPYPPDGQPAYKIAGAVLLLAGISTAAFHWRRKYPYLAMGWLWYVVMLLPVIGLVQVGAQAHADRYTYLPEIGLCIALAWAVKEQTASWANRQFALGVGASAIIVALVAVARAQAAVWHDSETLWEHTLACTTNNSVAEGNLANEYFQKGTFDKAIEHANAAIEINPQYADAHNCLGYALYQTGDLAGALSHFEEAVKIRPDFASAQNNFGMALLRAGKLDEALTHFREAVRLEPEMADAQSNLGAALVQKGKPEEALAHYQMAIQLKTDFLGAENNYAWVLASCTNAAVRNGAKAVELARRANESANSRNMIVLRTLAAAYAENGQFNQAIEAAGQALQMATADNNATWIRALQAEMELYRNGRPFRADGTIP
jgi:tetratricopeptide (TPR) repeat protein